MSARRRAITRTAGDVRVRERPYPDVRLRDSTEREA